MLEVAECVEVETDQYRDDLRIRHHALPATFWGICRGRKGVFRHLDFKFFAKIVSYTENFSNFTFGNHDMFLKFVTSKLLNISDITKRVGNLKKLPIQLFGVISYPELALIVFVIFCVIAVVLLFKSISKSVWDGVGPPW